MFAEVPRTNLSEISQNTGNPSEFPMIFGGLGLGGGDAGTERLQSELRETNKNLVVKPVGDVAASGALNNGAKIEIEETGAAE